MLFNGKLVFCQFLMLFNGNLRLEKLGGDYRHMEIHPCVLQDLGPLGPLPKKEGGEGGEKYGSLKELRVAEKMS